MYVPQPGLSAGLPQDPADVLPAGVAALVGAAALIVVLVPLLWPLARHFNVMAHEGAHALVGSVLGYELSGVTLNLDTGVTSFSWGPALSETAVRWVLTAFAGYLGPSAFGLGAAKLIETGRTVTVLWLAILLLVLLLLLVRKSAGIVSVPVGIALLAFVTREAHTGLEELVSYAIAWLLLLSGVRVAIDHGINGSDAHALSSATRVPRRIWALLWLAGALLAVVVGGKWLILRS